MTDSTDTAADATPTDATPPGTAGETAEAVAAEAQGHEVVVTGRLLPPLAQRGPRRALAGLRERAVELAQRPAVVAVASAGATVGVGLGVNLACRALGLTGRRHLDVAVTGQLAHRVDVVHHVVHQVSHRIVVLAPEVRGVLPPVVR